MIISLSIIQAFENLPFLLSSTFESMPGNTVEKRVYTIGISWNSINVVLTHVLFHSTQSPELPSLLDTFQSKFSMALIWQHVEKMFSIVKANIYAISSDTNQLQFIKLHHFKLEIFKSI